MYCTQCGCKIEDGFKFCPRCGKEIAIVANQDSEGSLESVVMNIFCDYSLTTVEKSSKIARITGIGEVNAGMLLAYAKDGTRLSALRFYPKLQKKYVEFKRKESNCCPKCGSKHIQYKQGSTWAYSGESITMIDAPRLYLRCVDCGNQWSMKSNQWENLY